MPLPSLHLPRLLALSTAAALMLGSGASAQAAVLPGIQLQDQHAAALTAASVAQRVVLLHFVFTSCSTTCPTQVRELAAVHDSLSKEARAHVRFLSVTVDPLSDTPATLAAFARRMDAQRPGWSFATGRPEQVQALVERMQAMAPGRQRAAPQDHRTSLYLFDASGELVQRFAGVPVDRPRLAAEITRLVAAKARTAH